MALHNRIWTTTVTIANGASLSGAVNLAGGRLLAIIMPAAWTVAGLTFQASMDGSAFADLVDTAGTEVTLAVVVAQYRVIPPASLPAGVPFRFLKVRSGTSGTPVNQGAARVLTLVISH